MLRTRTLLVLSTLVLLPQNAPGVTAAALTTIPAKMASLRSPSKRMATPDFSNQKRPRSSSPAEGAKRLPKFFGQLDLDPKQRQKVQAVQSKFKRRQTELKRQIDRLDAQLEKDLSKLLRPEQRRKLKQLADKRRPSKGR